VLAATVGCDRSATEESCTCDLGETRCEPGGDISRCVASVDPDVCNEWGPPQSCEEGYTCVGHACTCISPCSTGHTVCADTTSQHRCEGPDADQCYEWGSPEPCPAGVTCEGGSCGCTQFCTDGETACSPAGALLTCAGPDGEGCTRWNETECGAHSTCRGGACECAAPCEDDDARCDGDSAVIACAGPDADGCTHWDEPEPCEEGLECRPDVGPGKVGHCVPPIPEECADITDCDFEGQKICMDSTRYRECAFKGDGGCLELDCST
jgi:hypothetical protein